MLLISGYMCLFSKSTMKIFAEEYSNPPTLHTPCDLNVFLQLKLSCAAIDKYQQVWHKFRGCSFISLLMKGPFYPHFYQVSLLCMYVLPSAEHKFF